jgi:hypothetical protein
VTLHVLASVLMNGRPFHSLVGARSKDLLVEIVSASVLGAGLAALSVAQSWASTSAEAQAAHVNPTFD